MVENPEQWLAGEEAMTSNAKNKYQSKMDFFSQKKSWTHNHKKVGKEQLEVPIEYNQLNNRLKNCAT